MHSDLIDWSDPNCLADDARRCREIVEDSMFKLAVEASVLKKEKEQTEESKDA